MSVKGHWQAQLEIVRLHFVHKGVLDERSIGLAWWAVAMGGFTLAAMSDVQVEGSPWPREVDETMDEEDLGDEAAVEDEGDAEDSPNMGNEALDGLEIRRRCRLLALTHFPDALKWYEQERGRG